MRYTVDASVLVKLVVDEQHSQNALNLISDPRTILFAPDIIYYEVGSVLYKMARRGMIEKRYALQAYESLIKLPIDITVGDWNVLSNILEMSLRLRLHFYDCLYIYAAKKTGSTLVSSDHDLLSAASKECDSQHLKNLS